LSVLGLRNTLAAGLLGSRVGRVDVTEPDVRVDDLGVGSGVLDVFGLARVCRAGTTSDTGLGCVGIGGVVGVEPEHVGVVVVPDGEDENHSVGECLAHASHAALVLEGSGIAESRLLSVTIVGRDGIEGVHSRNVGLGVLNDLAILNVDATDLGETSGGRAAVGDELGDDGELLRGVDSEALAVEGFVALAEGVEVATIGIADGSVAVIGTTARGASALVETGGGTRMGGVGRRDGVGLPDIHLVTAGTSTTGSSVRVVVGWLPAFDVGSSSDELEVSGALRVAVASSVLGTSLVVGVLARTTVGVHLGEVESAVETAGELGNVDIEGELLVERLEELVGAVASHEVNTRTDVLLLAVGDKFEGEGIARGGDTVGTRVVGTIESAVLGASVVVGAERGVPSVTGVTVGISLSGVEPAPVGVEDDGARARGSTSTALRALLPGERRVALRLLGADLLCVGSSSEEGEGEERCFWEHCERNLC